MMPATGNTANSGKWPPVITRYDHITTTLHTSHYASHVSQHGTLVIRGVSYFVYILLGIICSNSEPLSYLNIIYINV